MKRLLVPGLILLGLALIASGLFLAWQDSGRSSLCDVIEVIDGDTIRVNWEGKAVRVRLIGVDAPEVDHPGRPEVPAQPFGKEARSFLKNLLREEKVWLEHESEKRDHYGRVLAYVYRASDGLFVNHEMIREGYAKFLFQYPTRHRTMFFEAERAARKSGHGIWEVKSNEGK